MSIQKYTKYANTHKDIQKYIKKYKHLQEFYYRLCVRSPSVQKPIYDKLITNGPERSPPCLPSPSRLLQLLIAILQVVLSLQISLKSSKPQQM